jgi:hypothetical protein
VCGGVIVGLLVRLVIGLGVCVVVRLFGWLVMWMLGWGTPANRWNQLEPFPKYSRENTRIRVMPTAVWETPLPPLVGVFLSAEQDLHRDYPSPGLRSCRSTGFVADRSPRRGCIFRYGILGWIRTTVASPVRRVRSSAELRGSVLRIRTLCACGPEPDPPTTHQRPNPASSASPRLLVS